MTFDFDEGFIRNKYSSQSANCDKIMNYMTNIQHSALRNLTIANPSMLNGAYWL